MEVVQKITVTSYSDPIVSLISVSRMQRALSAWDTKGYMKFEVCMVWAVSQ